MKKTLLIISILTLYASISHAKPPCHCHHHPHFRLDVQTHDNEGGFQIEVTTVKDQANPATLALDHLSIHRPSEQRKGLINLKLLPAGDAWIAQVGKQHGLFNFLKGEEDLAQTIPYGEYRLDINHHHYGILVVGPDNVFLSN